MPVSHFDGVARDVGGKAGAWEYELATVGQRPAWVRRVEYTGGWGFEGF